MCITLMQNIAKDYFNLLCILLYLYSQLMVCSRGTHNTFSAFSGSHMQNAKGCKDACARLIELSRVTSITPAALAADGVMNSFTSAKSNERNERAARSNH
jgi:hypothetical protein